MKKKTSQISVALISASFLFFSNYSKADEKGKFPIISGSVLYQFQADRLVSIKEDNIPANNAYIYIEPNFSLHFDENWSVKTQWRIQPNDVLTTRNSEFPERYRTIIDSQRGLGLNKTGILVEELKIHFENEDMKFFAGKFDPQFGTASRKSKRIGVFTSQFAEDYNLREKIGGGIVAFLEGSQISVNTFFNDTSGLSSSAINNRGREGQNSGLAGNTNTLSSYSVSMEGESFLSVKNLFYNVGYRSLDVRSNNRSRENGYVIGSEYLLKTGRESSLIPFVELVKIDNFTGAPKRNAYYSTFALLGKYRGWSTSLSLMNRNIKNNNTNNLPNNLNSISDRQFQISAGYKFTDNFTVDISRAQIKENKKTAGIIGVSFSYLRKF